MNYLEEAIKRLDAADQRMRAALAEFREISEGGAVLANARRGREYVAQLIGMDRSVEIRRREGHHGE